MSARRSGLLLAVLAASAAVAASPATASHQCEGSVHANGHTASAFTHAGDSNCHVAHQLGWWYLMHRPASPSDWHCAPSPRSHRHIVCLRNDGQASVSFQIH